MRLYGSDLSPQTFITGPGTSKPMRQEHPFPGSNGPLPPVATHLPEAASSNGSLQPQPVSTQEEEGREVGHVKWRVYRIYVGAVGPLLTTVIVVSLLLMQV